MKEATVINTLYKICIFLVDSSTKLAVLASDCPKTVSRSSQKPLKADVVKRVTSINS